MARWSSPSGARTRRPARRARRSISGSPARPTSPPGTCRHCARPRGVPLWVSGVLPGSTHDLTVARELVLPQARPHLKDLPFLADSGYEGAGPGVHVPVRKLAGIKELDPDTKTRNAL